MNPTTTTSVAAGIFVSAFGASCSFLLWAYKAHYGRVLRSMVLLAVSRGLPAGKQHAASFGRGPSTPHHQRFKRGPCLLWSSLRGAPT